MKKKNLALAGASIVVGALGNGSAALAQASSERTDIIVTAQRIAEAQEEIDKRPGGASIVEADVFRNKVAISLKDALAFSAGVYTQPRFGQEVRLSIRGSGISRGFHMRGLTLLQDGVTINQADDNGDFQELDPQVFERIEIYRGGNALRFGGSTLGGAINAITPTGRSASGVELRLDGGSFATVRGKLGAGFNTERGDAYLALTADKGDGDRQHAKRDALRFNSNVGLKISDDVETRFYATLSHINQDLPGSLTREQAIHTPGISLPNNIAMDQERDIDSVRVQNHTTITIGPDQTLTFGGFFNAKELFHPIFQVIDQKSVDRGLFASLDLGGHVAGIPWALTFGSQARFGKVRARQYTSVSGSRDLLVADATQTARTINTFAELRVNPLSKLTVVLGTVLTNGRRAVDNRLLPINSDAVAYTRLAPKFGLLWSPLGNVQVFANYSRSVELPGFGELIQQPVVGFVALKAQRAWTAELGTRGHIGIASWDVSLYRADLRGELLQFTVDPNIPASTFNSGRTRHQGIEASLTLRPFSWMRLRQVYQHNDFQFRADTKYGNNALPVVPKDQYRAELRLGTDTVGLSPSVEWTPRGAWADYTNSSRTPGYVTLGLGTQIALSKGLTLFVDARNLTDKKGIGDISATINATPNSVIYYPLERRSVYGGVRATF
ncbi:ligand-gated channel protein (plasmid) [Sphingobium sp. SCG-1]|uniref:TonB-dependent receptor family protein n=1 Tax=Sphingobium sp. SCG-1 TaxID=2072936 RepID=UPI000CD68706|nr:TonB-dependent receptor [Sphingobium sp. SCG-1]AUW60619.1 ligand-gated channel protein [Sphingobium sp. SCG-1]